MRLNLDEEMSGAGSVPEGEPLPPHDPAPAAAPRQLELLYRTHRLKLVRFVRNWGRPDQAHDIVQQVFVWLAGQRGDVIPAIHAKDAYLRQVARNLVRNETRSAARRSAPLHLCLDDIPLAAPDPVAALEARDTLRRFEAVVARLEPRTREIFLAHRIDGFTYGEIAHRTGLDVKTIEKHMSRAIAFLGRHFQA